MKAVSRFTLFALSSIVLAHGGHDGPAKGETNQQYAQRHMSSEHHIDAFDTPSFFKLHDLNRDGVWDKDEIEAIYGVHHVYSQKKSKDDIEHQDKADFIVKTILDKLDSNKDGKISVQELEAVGLDGLPNFDHIGAEGHHYDIESEFFLHHEEQYHNTPETQTDESYTHPEDLEHFAHHAEIERKEAEKEAKFQGISVDDAIKQHENQASTDSAQKVLVKDPIPAHPHDEQVESPKSKVTRMTPPEKQQPEVKYKDAKAEGQKRGEWGSGESGYKSPVKPGDKMRKNLPYKYKFRRNWGDF